MKELGKRRLMDEASWRRSMVETLVVHGRDRRRMLGGLAIDLSLTREVGKIDSQISTKMDMGGGVAMEVSAGVGSVVIKFGVWTRQELERQELERQELEIQSFNSEWEAEVKTIVFDNVHTISAQTELEAHTDYRPSPFPK